MLVLGVKIKQRKCAICLFNLFKSIGQFYSHAYVNTRRLERTETNSLQFRWKVRLERTENLINLKWGSV